MKRKSLIMAILVVIIAAVMGLTACNSKGNTASAQYTIKFATNGGNAAINPVTVDKGGSVNLPSPTRDNFTFDGWFDNKNLKGEKLSTPYFPTANKTLYAKWKEGGGSYVPRTTYTLTFNTLGGSDVEPMTVAEGSALNLPVASREGYTFIAWCTDIFVLNTFTLAQMPNSDITLYAKWEYARAFKSAYLTAKGFTEFTDPRLDVLYPNFDGKKLRTKLTSDDVGEMGVTKYNLNTNLIPKTGYLIKWFSSATFTDLIGTQRSVLGYSDNIFFATISDSRGRVLETLLVDLYVRLDFTYNYYDTPYRFHMNHQTKPDRVERVVEDDYPAPTTPDNDYVFKTWTDANSDAFNFNVKVAKSKDLFASYDSVDCAVDLNDGTGNAATVTYKPFEEFEDITAYDKEDKVFAGFKAGDVFVVSGDGTVTEEAKSVSMETVKNLTAQWGDYTDENYFDFVRINDKYGSLIGYSVSLVSGTVPSKIYVPNRYNGMPVLAIYSFANENVKELKIPDSVTEIVSGAFKGCNNLEIITLPFVGRYADASQVGATHFGYVFGASSYSDNSTAVPAKLKTVVITGGSIGSRAFYGCSGLTSVTIGSGVKSIGYSAFYGCSGLTSVTIGSGLTSIGSSAFYGCSKLTSITIPNTVTSIGSSAFENCSGLTSITIPDTVTSIGESAFENCSKLTSVTIGRGVESISSSAFYDCSGLTAVYYTGDIAGWCGISFGNGYSNPLYYAHNLYINNTLVTELIIPNSVTSIGENAFYGCSGLTSITIPNSVTSIGSSAFENCSGLTSITISDTVTSIGENAFENCSGLTSITIPDSVTSIGYDAFRSCSKLTSVTIGSGVTSIGNYAFKDCSKLTSVKWNAINCESVGSSNYPIFSGCTSLTSIEFGDGVKTIPSYAFYGCSKLTSITIPDSVTSIGNYAFYECYKLIEVYNLSSLNITTGSNTHGEIARYAKNIYTSSSEVSKITTADGYMFYNDNGKYYLMGYSGTDTKLTLPNGYNGNNYAIYDYAFSSCSGLTSITIPDSVTSIGDYAFEYCSGLTSVTIGSGVIGDYAFYNCSGLTSITIPDTVTSIGESAFENCSGLTNVTIGSGVTTIGNWAFAYCYKLIEVNNLSSLDITAGSTTHGYVAQYAKNVYKPTSGESKITTADGYIFYNDNGSCHLMGYNGTDTALTLPNDYNGKNYSIYNYAFAYCSALTSITIPDSVTSIGYDAFRSCSGLTSVTIGSGVIGDYAFYNCYSLTSITIGSGVTTIGSNAFYYCGKLTSITFNGTIAKWKAISKDTDWAQQTPSNFKVICTDGTLSKSEAGGND